MFRSLMLADRLPEPNEAHCNGRGEIGCLVAPTCKQQRLRECSLPMFVLRVFEEAHDSDTAFSTFRGQHVRAVSGSGADAGVHVSNHSFLNDECVLNMRYAA